MKAFSLFSGIGGFDLALKRNGVEIVGACEIDKYARQVYGKHFPGVKIHENATTIEPKEIPNHSIFVAGFPCQSFSIAGNRRGFNDTRGTLFFEIQKIVEEKQPSILLLENVLGLLSHEKGRTFATILDTLDAMGYDVEWQVLNSKYFVPQNRERVFIVGHLRGKRARKIFPIGENITKTNSKKLIRVGNIDQKGHNSIWGRVYSTDGISATINAHGGGLGAKTGLYTIPKIVADRTRKYAGKGRNLESPKDISNSLTSIYKDNLVLQFQRIRKLTPLECERLQGFPDNWTEGHADQQRYTMCGNAVTVPVVEYLVKELLR